MQVLHCSAFNDGAADCSALGNSSYTIVHRTKINELIINVITYQTDKTASRLIELSYIIRNCVATNGI